MSDHTPLPGTVRKLQSNETAAFRDHLLRLDKESRRLRFAHSVSDTFIEDYAASSAGIYRGAKDLPKQRSDASNVTDIWFKLEGVPAKYDQQLLQVDLHRWDEKTKNWSQDRWATGDRQVFGKGQLWQQHLSVTAPRDSTRAKENVDKPALPPGKYLAKIYIDQTGKLQKDYQSELGPSEFVGQVEIDSRWPAGYGAMTIARYAAK